MSGFSFQAPADVPLFNPCPGPDTGPCLKPASGCSNGTDAHAARQDRGCRLPLGAESESTNLNLTSWLGNWELDVAVHHEPFARAMEQMFLEDLSHATEVVLTASR